MGRLIMIDLKFRQLRNKNRWLMLDVRWSLVN
jgi:hypothetical protein